MCRIDRKRIFTGAVFILLLFVVPICRHAAAGDSNSVRMEALRCAFPLADRVEKKTERLSKGQTGESLSLKRGMKRLFPKRKTGALPQFTYFVAKQGENKVGYAVFGEGRGRHSRFTFLVATNEKGLVTRVELLCYKGKFGGEIGSGFFTRQFRGKSWKDRLKVGADIDAVTGATISSRELTGEVKRILLWLQIVILDVEAG